VKSERCTVYKFWKILAAPAFEAKKSELTEAIKLRIYAIWAA